jgi:hypothetical protein
MPGSTASGPAPANRGCLAIVFRPDHRHFKDRRFEANERLLERQDAQVQFDFGTDGPIPQKFDPHHFSIRWEGSVLAPDTGEYEFIVHTEHAVRLWVDGGRQPYSPAECCGRFCLLVL